MTKMWFREALSQKLCILTTVFCSTMLTSKCRAMADAQGQSSGNDDDAIHIFRTEVPWEPIELDAQKNVFAIMAWTAVLSVAVSVAAIVCLCCLCWKLYPKYGPRRQSSNAALVPPRQPATVIRYPAVHQVDSRTARTSRRENSYNAGITSLAFVGSLRDPATQLEEGPPAYSIVISEAFPSDKLASTSFPRVGEIKTVETPPPAYVTVAPFQ